MRFAPTVACCVISTLLSASFSPADACACINGVKMEESDAVKRIAQVEFHLRYEQYWLADLAIPFNGTGRPGLIQLTDPKGQPGDHYGGDRYEHDPRLVARLTDAHYLLDLRWRTDDTDLPMALLHFAERFDRQPSPKYAAWLAEAYATDDIHVSSALLLLRDLEKRDLMPDAHAYATLARLTTGHEHGNAATKCHLRAVVKSICPPLPITI